ncbi:hypothetical protein EZS27_021855 [termite gut metagenome]|uniref:Uncharacterized protein n=1 Tax=termite gut metagenome TaxID=433724 RepID=A0A5J4R8J8_9ZZZZ
MNIIKFNENFPDEITCILQFKEQKDRIGVIVLNVVVKSITGCKTSCVMSVSIVIIVSRCVRER